MKITQWSGSVIAYLGSPRVGSGWAVKPEVGEPGRKLRKRIAANRGHLFVLMTNRAVPYTNNVSERNLRSSVIFRKVTNGFRCEWGAHTYAAFRSIVSTAKANRAPVLNALRTALLTPLTLPGEQLPGSGLIQTEPILIN